jgi:superfamily II DNA helicase RecQ
MIQVGLIEMAYDDSFTLKVSEFGKRVIKLGLKIDLANAQDSNDAFIENAGAMQKDFIEAEHPLLLRLKAFRKEFAKTLNVPPYVIFTDKTLEEIIEKEPINEAELLRVSGISAKKMKQAGNEIIAIVRNHKGLPDDAPVNVDEVLAIDKIKIYLRRLNQVGIEPNMGNLAKVLVGNKNAVIEGIDLLQFDFYGLLAGQYAVKEVKPMIESKLQNLFIAHKPENNTIETSNTQSQVVFNTFDDDNLKSFKVEVAKLPVLRPTESIQNVYILEQRKSYERAYEPWEEMENSLLLKAAAFTNDADYLASIFKRNPSSIKIQLAKLLLKQQLLEEI